MNTRSISFITGIVIVFLYGRGSSEQPGQHRQEQAQVRPATLVKTQQVQLHDLNVILELPGTLEPESMANVLSSTEGKITRMDVRQGDQVTDGQVLAMLSPLLREDIINAARLNLQGKEAAVEHNPEDNALIQELVQARSDYEFALRQYREIPVIAPVNGIVSDRWVDMGDMVPARHKMFEIQSSRQLLVKVPVSELDIRKLEIGQNARISSDACPDQTFRGSIQRIYPQVDRQSRNATVEVLLPDPCPQLRSGMFVRTAFITSTRNQAVAVPADVLMERGGQKLVFVVEDNEAIEVFVETGLESNGLVEIIHGLQAGQQLVVEGQEQLQGGRPVRIQQDPVAQKQEGGAE